MTIQGMLGAHPLWVAIGWWVTVVGRVGAHPCYDERPSLGWWVPRLSRTGGVSDHPGEGGLTILGRVSDSFEDSG